MAVYDSKRCFFIHIQKTGGSTVLDLLKPFAGENQVDPHGDDLTHIDAEEHRRRFPATWENYFKFSIVRNPWDRTFSFFNYFKHYHINPTIKKMDFDTFVDFAFIDGHFDPLGGLKSQYDFLKVESTPYAVDYVARFEKYEKEIKTISQILDIDLPKRIPRINGITKRKRKDEYTRLGIERSPVAYREFYTKRTKKIVKDYWVQDVETLGYQF